MVGLAASGVLMDGFNEGLFWLTVALLAFKLYAFVDAVFRRPAAFPAVGKQTKTFWLVVLGFAVVVFFLPVPLMGQMLSLIGLVAAIVYMVDVRPRVKAIAPQRTGRLGAFSKLGLGRSKVKKDDGRNHMGPYGPW
jgi:hypothetical protein